MEPAPSTGPDSSVPTVNEPVPTRTRSGRVSKPPVRYEPVEQVEDDYNTDDYDSDEDSDISSDETGSDEESCDEEDADEYGNLDGFVVPDKSESDSDSNGSRSAPVSVVKKRTK
jgi:hypothetical protein